MLFVAALLAVRLFVQQPSTPAAGANCTAGPAGAADICQAEQEFAQADNARAAADRRRHLQAALDLYRKAASAANDTALKITALDEATRVLDAMHLNDPAALELTLRDLIGLAPNDLRFMFRLATVEEDQGELDSAEETLLSARRQQPQELEPYRMLAQFYARRATRLSNQTAQAKPAADSPGVPDKDGVYRIGPGMTPPQRADTPLYPEDAKAAGVSGMVAVEIVVNEQGVVADAKVVRSVPLLDEAAVDTVRQWRFRPSRVNGQPVPVRMVVNVMFQSPNP
ncbi:MAG TPA: energy transducer TonB [Vicinamibacterales bacterium]|jgi:TonB family protein|nr:energy transducer TonB [Vicinamibacterales bacterium]